MYQFETFSFYPKKQQRVWITPEKADNHGEEKLEYRVSQFLELLISNFPETVSRQTIKEKLWSNENVSDASLRQLIKRARVAIGDENKNPRYIKTVYGIGFCWMEEPMSISQTGSSQDLTAAVKQNEESSGSSKDRVFISNKWLLSSISLFVLMVTASLGWSYYQKHQPNYFEEGYPISLVVLPFENNTKNTKFDWVELGLMDMVGQSLNESAGIQNIAASKVLSYMANYSTVKENPSVADYNEMFHKVCGSLGCDLLLISTVSGEPEPNILTYQLVSANGVFPPNFVQSDTIIDAANLMVNVVVEKIDPAQPWTMDFRDSYSDNEEANQAYAMGLQALISKDLATARSYFEIALKHKDDFTWAKARLAELGFYLSDYEMSYGYIDEILAMEQVSAEIRFHALHVKSNVLSDMGKLSEAIELAKELLVQANHMGNPLLQANEELNLGRNYLELEEMATAMDWFTKAQHHYELSGYLPGLFLVNFNLGTAYVNLTDYPSAIRYYESAYDIAVQLDSRLYQAATTTHLAQILKFQEKYEQAILSFETVKEIFHELDSIESELLVAVEIAAIRIEQGKATKSIEEIQAILESIEKHKLVYARYRAYQNIAYAYLTLHQPDDAQVWLSKSHGYEGQEAEYSLFPAMLAYEQKDLVKAASLAREVQQERELKFSDKQLNTFNRIVNAGENGVWTLIHY